MYFYETLFHYLEIFNWNRGKWLGYNWEMTLTKVLFSISTLLLFKNAYVRYKPGWLFCRMIFRYFTSKDVKYRKLHAQLYELWMYFLSFSGNMPYVLNRFHARGTVESLFFKSNFRLGLRVSWCMCMAYWLYFFHFKIFAAWISLLSKFFVFYHESNKFCISFGFCCYIRKRAVWLLLCNISIVIHSIVATLFSLLVICFSRSHRRLVFVLKIYSHITSSTI